jgi:putative hydrolase of the HAD superfamily
MKALLIDMWDTIAWAPWPELAERTARLIGVSPATWQAACESTRKVRGEGRCGCAEGSTAALVKACGVALDPARIKELSADHVAWLRANSRLYDDVLPTLRRLRAAGTRVAVVSNCDHGTREVIEVLRLEPEVDALVLSCEVGSLKPEAPIFAEALRRLNARPQDSLFIDDQAKYLDGAAALGIGTMQIVRRVSFGEPSAPSAHRMLSALDEIASDDS